MCMDIGVCVGWGWGGIQLRLSRRTLQIAKTVISRRD